jgi:pimeloyl-ACP methyl ester carboxylesterase
MEPAEGFVSVGGLRLFYLEWGERGAPPLVLLHDLGQSADVWRPVAPRLTLQFHVFAVDMRGHGDSDWIDTYSPQEQGDDIGELIERLGLLPAAVMGAGMGGRAGALLAARQEHAVSRLVMIGAGVRMYLPAARDAAQAILAMPRVYESPEEYLREWWALRGALGLSYHSEPPEDADTAMPPNRLLRQLSSGGYGLKFDADGHLRYREWSPGTRTVDYHDEYDQITCPVLLVRGADTPLLSQDEAEATATVIGDCSVVEVPNARHDVLADNPDALLEAVLPFLSKR